MRALSLLLLLACLLSQAVCSPDAEDAAAMREGRLFAFYSTTSQTSLTTTTITKIYTCLSTVTTPTCLGRKKRMNLENPDFALVDVEEDLPNLDGSLNINDDENEEAPGSLRQGKKLTIWSTAFTTLTLTSTSLLAGTTVSASALCAAAAITAGCFIG